MDLRTLLKSSGVRNFTKLLSANVVAQVIGLVVYPILTRMYAPEDFGLLNLFLSIGNVLVVLAVLDYYYAIVLPKEEKDAVALTQTSFFCLLLTVGLVLLSVAFAKPISILFKMPDLTEYYWLMPIYVLAMGAWNILNYWYIRHKEYGCISRYQVSQSVLSAGGKLGFGALGWLHGGMIFAMVIVPVIALLLSLFSNMRKTLVPWCNVSKHTMWQQGKQYRNFPLFVLPRSFINVLATQLPVLLLTPFFGAKYVGLLSMAVLLAYTPIGTISRAIYQVLYQHTTEYVHQSRPIKSMFRRFIGYTSVVIIPIFGILYFVLPNLTAWLLGEEWRVVGEYIRWMLPWLYVSLLTGSTCYLSDVFMQQHVGLFFEVLLAICRIGGLLVGICANDFLVAIAAYSIGTAIAVLAQLIWLASLVRRYDKSLA